MNVHMEHAEADICDAIAAQRMNESDLRNKAYDVAKREAAPRLRRAAARLTETVTDDAAVDMTIIPGAHDVRLDLFVNLHLTGDLMLRSRVSVSSLDAVESIVEAPWFVATCRNCGYQHQSAGATSQSLAWLHVALRSCSCGCGLAVAA